MKRRIIAFATLLLVLMLSIPNTVYALDYNPYEWGDSAHVVVESYSITNERIIPGDPFVLTLVIKNASKTATAKDTLVEITNPAGVAPEYGKVAEFYLGNLEPESSQTIELKYNTWTSISTDTLDFYVTIATVDRTHTTTLRIPAGDEDPFAVLSLDIPDSGKQGDSLSTSLTFKVLGEKTRRDVAYVIKVDGEEAVTSSIGIMSPGATKTSAVAFSIPDVGVHKIEVLLRYSDESGQIFSMPVGNKTISIEENENQPVEVNDSDFVIRNESGPDYVGMGAMAGVIVLLFFTVVIILKKK